LGKRHSFEERFDTPLDPLCPSLAFFVSGEVALFSVRSISFRLFSCFRRLVAVGEKDSRDYEEQASDYQDYAQRGHHLLH
jgi:hypothetical protein